MGGGNVYQRKNKKLKQMGDGRGGGTLPDHKSKSKEKRSLTAQCAKEKKRKKMKTGKKSRGIRMGS